MPANFRIEGFAIISADGAIANDVAIMPPSLLYEADKQYYTSELDRFDAMVHGRNSHEGQPHSASRRRIVLSRRVGAVEREPNLPLTWLWNPAGASFEEAAAALGLTEGSIAVLGGTDVFDLFLGIGYDAFHLSRASKANLPTGVPVFSDLRRGRTPEDVLKAAGFEPGPVQVLDEANGVTLVDWLPRR